MSMISEARQKIREGNVEVIKRYIGEPIVNTTACQNVLGIIDDLVENALQPLVEIQHLSGWPLIIASQRKDLIGLRDDLTKYYGRDADSGEIDSNNNRIMHIDSTIANVLTSMDANFGSIETFNRQHGLVETVEIKKAA